MVSPTSATLIKTNPVQVCLSLSSGFFLFEEFTSLFVVVLTANSTQMCNGAVRDAIYSIATSRVAKASTSVPGYKGCYQTGNFTTNASYLWRSLLFERATRKPQFYACFN